MPDFVAFDLETTGLSPKSDRIIEVGAVRFGPDMVATAHLEVLVDPRRPVPLAVQRLTGLADADLRGGAVAAEAVAQLAEFCAGADLVAHGAGFDLHFCAALLPEAFAGRPVIDTLELARILMPMAASHSLPLLARSLGIGHDRPHRALSDADATRALFAALVQAAEALPGWVLTRMRMLLAASRGPLAAVLVDLVREGGGAEPAAPASPLPVPARGGGARVGLDLAGLPLVAAAAAVLGPGGPLAGRMEGYELREPQVEMARAVAQTLERSGRLLVEAGTGVGKSLAYLVPLALWAQRSRGRAVVATHTITLQEQLGEQDLPAVVALLGIDDLDWAVLKGRQQYISLRRWERFLAGSDHGEGGAALEVLRFKLKLLVWLSQTTTGDRAELRLAGQEEGLWRRVESDSDDCLGAACANWRDRRCHMVAARRAAADADIVVTNHALLLADAERQGQVLTEYSALVVDEAHRLEEAATQQLGARLRAVDMLTVIDRLGGVESPTPGELEIALARARDGVTRLFGEVKGLIGELVGGENPGNATVGLRAELREDLRFAGVVRSAAHARQALAGASAALLQGRGRPVLQATFLPQPERLDDELELAAAALDAAAGVIERVLLRPRPGHVAWVELRAEQSELHEAPIEVAERLNTGLFERAGAVVLTSATLAVARSFDFVRNRTGMGEGAAELVLGSPFDFLAQALTVVAGGVPPYDHADYDAALAGLITELGLRLEGRTLVLFTGYAPLRAVHGLLRPRLEPSGIAVLGQGLDGTRRQVLAGFLENPRSVLLGTSTFWEGIDLPGDALRCVVIAKLPFPVPTDPLVQARGAGLRDPFAEYALPLAVLRLKQGFGRLIRRGDDRGAVVLCDSRIASRDYGRTFLTALPEALVAHEPVSGVAAVVQRFVRDGTVPAGAVRAQAPVAAGHEDWA